MSVFWHQGPQEDRKSTEETETSLVLSFGLFLRIVEPGLCFLWCRFHSMAVAAMKVCRIFLLPTNEESGSSYSSATFELNSLSQGLEAWSSFIFSFAALAAGYNRRPDEYAAQVPETSLNDSEDSIDV